ncbi:MAG: hypothetical protein ACE5JJ_04240 [Nitrospinota bacterium]
MRREVQQLPGIITAEDVMRAFGVRSQVHSEEGGVVKEEPVRLVGGSAGEVAKERKGD